MIPPVDWIGAAVSAPEIRRNTKHPDSSKLDPGFCLCGYDASRHWRLKPPFQERVRHFCFAVGSPAGRRLCCLGVSGAGVRSCVGTQQRNESETARATGVVLRSRTRSAFTQTRAGARGSEPCLHEFGGACPDRKPRPHHPTQPPPLNRRNQDRSPRQAASHSCFFAAFFSEESAFSP